MRYVLKDAFNGVILSRHKTIDAAVRAKDKHLRAVKRANGENSYLEYIIEDRSRFLPYNENE